MPMLNSDAVLRRMAIAGSLAVISVLAGCGGGGSDSTTPAAGSAQTGTGQAGAVQAVIENFGEQAGPADRAAMGRVAQEFLRARADGDWARACSLLAPAVVDNLRRLVSQNAQLKNKGCPDLVQAAIPIVPAKTIASAKRIEVSGARIEGDNGWVFYRDERGTSFAIPVAREGNLWKARAIVSTPLPQ
jgi:hypothetical protein